MTFSRKVAFGLWLLLVAGGLLMVWMTTDEVAFNYDGTNGPTIAQIIDCQPPGCLRVVIPTTFLDGSDGACLAAGQWLLGHFDTSGLRQLLITNRGWVPSAYRLVDRSWAKCLADIDAVQNCEERSVP